MTGKLEVVTEHVRLAAEGSLDFNAFYSRPRAGSGVGLILLHDMFGPSRVFEELAEEYAAKGCCVLLPNLFWRHAGPAVIGYDGHAVAGPREVAFDSDMAALDLRIAADWLRTAPGCSGKIVVWGFCFSGRLAYLAAARNRIDAAISFYALGISRYVREIGNVVCPLQIHYGARDPIVPPSETAPVARAAEGQAGVSVHFYESAGHSFFNKVRPTYDATASRLAAERVERLLADVGGKT